MRKNVDHVLLAILAIVCVLGALGWGTEWEFRRLLCPNCGEENHQNLPVYTVEEYPHILIEACDTCRVYLKAIDLTRDGLAVPEVDELASIAVDLWAKEKGYTKLQANLFGRRRGHVSRRILPPQDCIPPRNRGFARS